MNEQLSGAESGTAGRKSSKRASVLVLSFSTIIRDPRVLRQIDYLKGEYEVISCGYGPKPIGVIRHIEIPEKLVSWRKSYKKVAPLLALRAHHRLYFGSERVRFILDSVKPGSVDVVLANDALGMPVALALQPKYGVHADLHEYAPRQGEHDRRWRLLVGPLMDWACRRHVGQVASVSTVAQGIADEYARQYGIATPAVVPNAAEYAPTLSPQATHSPLRLIHTGAAGRGRKIEIMIDAVARANEIKPGTAVLDVVLVPGEKRYIEELRERAEAVPDNAVRMVEPVPFERIVPMLHSYDVGIFICPPSTFNLEHALPNKLFEFIQARLAVMIGPSPEMVRIVREHDLGVVTRDFTVESVAEAIAELSEGSVDRMKMASHAAAHQLGAAQSVTPWIDAVRRLVKLRSERA